MQFRLGTFLACVALATAPLVAAAPGGVPDDSSRLHVYVHYDYMVESDGTSYAPDPAAIDVAIAAYDAHGISLHIDPHHAEIPAHQMTLFGGIIGDCAAAADAVSFESLKSQYYRPTSNHPWKYAIFGVRNDCFGASGIAVINGDDFVVSLGQYLPLHFPRENMLRMQAGTFMHELGHTLGLDHGGLEPTNYKPNYLSVMSYRFQFGGIPQGAALGSVEIVGSRVDYSSQALATLDETNLDETVGINAGTKDITIFDTVDFFGVGPATGPIDWNLDGTATDRHVVSNINARYDGQLGQLSGFDDWSYVIGVLRGTITRGPPRLANHDRAHRPEVLAVDPASGTILGGTEVRIHGAHLMQVDHVAFGGTPAASYRIESDNSIVAIAPPGTGTVHVNVLSEGNPSPTISADLFTYLRPVIRDVIPGSTFTNTTITVVGERLATTTDVLFPLSAFYAASAAGFTVVDDNTLLVQTPVGCTVGCDGIDRLSHVLVFTRDYGRSQPSDNFSDPATYGDYFSFLTSPRPFPVITSITPSSGPPGTTVTILGSGFHFIFGSNGCCEQTPGLVAFGGAAGTSQTNWSADRITVNAPPGTGTVDVRVFDLIGKSATGPQARFTYTAP